MPAVSVIVPVYNTKTLLPRCVAPLQAQTWQGFEVWLRVQQAFFECHYFFS